MNNKFMNMGNSPIQPQMLLGKKTLGTIKFLLFAFIGILPLLLCCMFISAGGDYQGTFHQWGDTGEVSTATTQINYGYMWLIGLGVYVLSIASVIIISKIFKQVNIDTIPIVSAGSMAMLDLFVIPHTAQAFLILSLPSFAIIGYFIGVIVMIFNLISNAQKKLREMENDPNVKNMVQNFENEIKKNNPNLYNKMKNNTKPNNKNIKYEDNPYVDLKEDKEEDKKEDKKKIEKEKK